MDETHDKLCEPSPGPSAREYVRCIYAVLEALSVLIAAACLQATLHGIGEILGAVLATWMAYLLTKRLTWALCASDEYPWFSRHLLPLIAPGTLLIAVAWISP